MKVTKIENIRVQIMPDNYLHPEDTAHTICICKQIVEDVKRHIDGIGDVSWECDTNDYCDACGLLWELDEYGIPCCCGKAIEEHEQAINNPTALKGDSK